MKNYYEVLHLANFAEIEVVKAAYRAISKLYHPDINKNVDPSVMTEINLAYEVLGDEDKKRNYDIQLSEYINNQNFKHESKNSKEDSHKQDYNTYYEEHEEKRTEPKTKGEKIVRGVGKVAWGFVNSFLDGARELQKESENAYYEGINYDDIKLIKKYIRSTGAKRNGYAQVLIDRGILYKAGERLVPAYSFKDYFKQ